MDSEVKIYLERSENELRLARAIFILSGSEKIKLSVEANSNDTFYSGVISHAYYCIFYCAKSFLLSKNIKTRVPDEKWKRGHFLYKTLAQANKNPAKESIDNTIKFLSHVKVVLEDGI